MSRIAMCIDCPNYQKGGYCRHKKKDVGALSPACDHALTLNEKFNPEDEEATMETAAPEPRKMEFKAEPAPEKTKKCRTCGRELPLSEYYERRDSKDGLESSCKECRIKDAAEKCQRRRETRAAKRPLPEQVNHKVCKHCGRDLPLSEYYMKDGKPNWICKECTKAYNVQKAKERRDAKAAKENAGATTKVCKICGRELPLDAFGGHAKTWDNKATVCKECMVEKLTKNKEKARRANPTPAPVLDESIKTVKAAPVDEPILLADIDTSGSLENFESKRLVEELRARGYTVTCSRPITIIEEL